LDFSWFPIFVLLTWSLAVSYFPHEFRAKLPHRNHRKGGGFGRRACRVLAEKITFPEIVNRNHPEYDYIAAKQ
jgi:hypothetical protein